MLVPEISNKKESIETLQNIDSLFSINPERIVPCSCDQCRGHLEIDIVKETYLSLYFYSISCGRHEFPEDIDIKYTTIEDLFYYYFGHLDEEEKLMRNLHLKGLPQALRRSIERDYCSPVFK